jgi:hypothetical protein
MEPLGEEKRNVSPDGVVIASVVGSKSSRPENAIAVTSCDNGSRQSPDVLFAHSCELTSGPATNECV